MKVIVFGATGGTGRSTVQELLEGGHEVTAFSRHAPNLGIESERLHPISGDALDAEEVERALVGQDAVVVSLGVNDNPLKVRMRRSRTPVDVCSRGTRNIIAGMNKLGLRKLVVVSAYGVGDTRDRLPLIWKLVYRLLLKEQIDDKEVQERLVRDSGLDWIIVQPVGLTNQDPNPDIHVSDTGMASKSTIPRRNVGRFLASVISGNRFLRSTVVLSG